MLTDTAPRSTHAASFFVRGVAISLGLFGIIRLHWIEAHVVLPLTRLQGVVAARLIGAPALPIETTLACSGADAAALCLAAIFAYPVAPRARVLGAAGGVALVLALNTVRIGTLGRAVASPAWFNALHVYIWPAILTLAIGGYMVQWIHRADRIEPRADDLVRQPVARAAQPARRFMLFGLVFSLVFLGGSSLYLESPAVLRLAMLVAQGAAVTLDLAGIKASAAGNVLWTPRGGFLVTQECISTPLIPIYLAAVCTYVETRRLQVLAIVATLPLFLALGVLRLLVVALPDAISPLFFVHAFYQLLAGMAVVFLAAVWRHGRRAALLHALAGIVVAALFAKVCGPWLARAAASPITVPLDDPQGAIAFLPVFQYGLYLALWVAAFVAVGWTRFIAGVAVLGLTQTAGLLALNALSTHAGWVAHVRDVRGWAIAGPVLIFAAVVHGARPHR